VPAVRVGNNIQLHLDNLRPKAQTSGLPEKLVKDKNCSFFTAALVTMENRLPRCFTRVSSGNFFRTKKPCKGHTL
jgi:hypothetical protein